MSQTSVTNSASSHRLAGRIADRASQADLSSLEPSISSEGITTAVVQGLFGRLKNPKPTRVAIIGCCVQEHFPFDVACRNFSRACDAIVECLPLADFHVIRAQQPFEDPAEMLRFADQLLAEPLAGVIFFHASYTAGEIGAHLGRWLAEHNIPVLSWSFPDERGGRLQANSLCCQNFILNMWHRLDVRYAWIHEAIGPAAHSIIGRFARSVRARDRLRHSRVLHAGGSRVTGFYDGEADELAIMRRFGVQFDRIDLQAVYEVAQRVAREDVELVRETLLRHPRCSAIDVSDGQVDQTLRFGLAIYKQAVETGYIGCTIKSWPEMFSCYGCAIDGAVSLLNDAGVCTSEEGDMNALLSSLAIHCLTGGAASPVTMDLSGLHPSTNRLGVWHCGACPTRVLKTGATYDARRHSILENADPASAVGLVLEFLLELGPVTLARYQSPDAASMLSFDGRLVETAMAFRGSYCEFEPSHATATRIMGTILSAGLDHHWCLGYGHLSEDLGMLNHWLAVRAIPLVEREAADGLSCHPHPS